MLRAAAILAVAATAALATGGAGTDGHDELETVDDLRRLEGEAVPLASRLLPTVVNLRTRERRATATGSGVVITPDGLVVTCGHLAKESGKRIVALLPDGTELSGVSLGQADHGTIDCGLVKLDTGGRSLDCAPLGRSSAVEPGDWVVTMGYTQGPPEEARPALVRVGRVVRSAPGEVLIDAPIDAGDSGGPAFSLNGEVVAVNTRCGRQPWQNAATPIDRLRERMREFLDSRDEEEFRAPTVDDDGPGDDVPTDFLRAGTGSGRLAVQRGLPLEGITAPAMASMLQVTESGRIRCVATAVDSDGHLVTKRSELPAGWRDGAVDLRDAAGRTRTAAVVGTDPALDLAVLRLDGPPLPALRWARSRPLQPGQVLLTPRFDESGPALGFAAIARRESERDMASMPYLGVRTEQVAVDPGAADGRAVGARVEEVVPGSAADAAGLRVGDVVLAVDGEPPAGRMGLRRLLADRSIGERVELQVLRDGRADLVAAELGRRPSSEGGARTRGNTRTAISVVSSGFGHVLAHDGIVWPEQCGGPVVDLDGEAVGINIARYDRTATHALDPKTVMKAAERIIRDSARTREAGSAPR
jgi:serine protease Do